MDDALFMYKKVWDPENMRYIYRNFQTGDGLLSGIKAFGKSLMGSIWKSGKNQAKNKLTAYAERAVADKVVPKFKQLYVDEDKFSERKGKDKIFKILNRRSRKKTNGHIKSREIRKELESPNLFVDVDDYS